jgi:DNA invertase Pin-like site-specific DNA recombinase
MLDDRDTLQWEISTIKAGTVPGVDEFNKLADDYVSSDPTIGPDGRRVGARTKAARLFIEQNSITGRKDTKREVDPTLPTILITYRRISSVKANSVTWARQEEDMRRAAQMHNINLATTARDFAEDGSSYKSYHRGQFEAMRVAIGEFTGKNPIILLLSDWDRAARKRKVAEQFVNTLRTANVKLIIASMPYLDLYDKNMEHTLQQLITTAEMASQQTSYRALGGQERRADMERYRGTTPAIGLSVTHVIDPQQGSKPVYTPSIEPREDYPGKISEAQLVKKVFEMYRDGTSISSISLWLNGQRLVDGKIVVDTAMRFPTQRGAKGWSDQGVRNILTNPHYNGQYIFRGETRKNADGSSRKTHKAIIDDELWEAVQLILAGHKHRRKPRRDSYKLSGLLVCSHCGGKLCGKKATGRGPFSYFCNVGRTDKMRCGAHALDANNKTVGNNMISGPGLEAFVYDILSMLIAQDNGLIAQYSNLRSVDVSTDDRQKEIIAEISEMEALVAGIIGNSRVIVAQRDSLNASIAAAREELANLIVSKNHAESFSRVAFSSTEEFDKLWNSTDRPSLILALKTIIRQIEIVPNSSGVKMNQWDLKKRGWKVNLDRVRIVWNDGTVFDGAALAKPIEAPDAQ